MSSKVLIINPKHPFKLDSPSLGIGYILAYCKKMSNSSIRFLDENFIEKPDIEIIKIIRERKIDFVGISFPSVAIMRVIDICKLIREHFNNTVQIFAGGYHTTSEPELTLRLIPQLDFIIIGEAEHIVSNLNYNWKKLGNVAYLENDTFIQNPISFIKNIDEIPFPHRNDFDSKYFTPAYGAISGIYGKVATIMSSRGCPYSCNFCSSKIVQKIVRYHRKNYVLSEIDHILSVVGNIDYLYFLDVMFLTKWSRVEELCNEFIHHKFYKYFKWAATVSANAVDEKKVKLMKEAGCFYLSFGFESDSEKVLKIINKRATLEDNRKACLICKKHNIYINSAFLFGIPGEKAEDLQKSIDFVKKNNVHFTGVNIMKPLPGSPFYYDFVKRGLIKPSIYEWHTISSINLPGKIYNDCLNTDQYNKYIKKFNRTIRTKNIINNISANWKKRLKYFLYN